MQLNFLRLLSTSVSQQIVIKCKSVVVWFHKTTKSYRYSWKFHGPYGKEFSASTKSRPKVMRDNCKVCSPLKHSSPRQSAIHSLWDIFLPTFLACEIHFPSVLLQIKHYIHILFSYIRRSKNFFLFLTSSIFVLVV